jgi:hypothetical protein
VTLNSICRRSARLSSTLDYAAAFPRFHSGLSIDPRRINP